MRGRERAYTRDSGKAKRRKKVSQRERKAREKRWRGSYHEAVEFLWANRGPITEKDTCWLTEEPIAS